jgi:hypothetical protein
MNQNSWWIACVVRAQQFQRARNRAVRGRARRQVRDPIAGRPTLSGRLEIDRAAMLRGVKPRRIAPPDENGWIGPESASPVKLVSGRCWQKFTSKREFVSRPHRGEELVKLCGLNDFDQSRCSGFRYGASKKPR